MKARIAASLLFAGALTAFVSSVQAQIIEFRATISAAQETPPTPSTATGSATLWYDVSANTFDLVITIKDLANTLTASHIHEGAVGVAGPVVTNLGADAVYTRSGTTVTRTFRDVVHGGNKLTLLQNGAYLNFHSAAFPGGEIRGQLIAQPKRLYAIVTPAQEIAATPIVSTGFGAALISYNPGTNKVTTQINLFQFTNTLTASHYHEAPAGVNGPVVTNFGAAAAYATVGGFIAQTFTEQTYGGDPIKLLTGGAYVNFHSNVYGGGEIRGQVWPSEDIPSSRLINASARGFVGTGNQVLIAGIGVTGREPVGVRIIGRGPSLSNYGVTGALADPAIALYGGSGMLASNDNHTLVLPAVIPALIDAKESVLDLVLPPGGYSIVISGAAGATGVGLVETFEQRGGASGGISLSSVTHSNAVSDGQVAASSDAKAVAMPELCLAPVTSSIAAK